MKRCQIKTGFFLQKEFCLDHIHGGLESIKNRKKDEKTGVVKAQTGEEAILCLECYALKNKEIVQKQYEGGYASNNSDLLWYFYMRDRFYHETSFRPFSNSDKDSLKTTSQDFDDDNSSNSFFDS